MTSFMITFNCNTVNFFAIFGFLTPDINGNGILKNTLVPLNIDILQSPIKNVDFKSIGT